MASNTASSIGAWRDRTNLFISYRQSYTHHPSKRQKTTRFTDDPYSSQHNDHSESAGLMSGDNNPNDAVIEMDLLPPRWLDIQDEVSSLLSDVQTKMKRLDSMHAKHVLPGFDDESVKTREERDISALTQEITRNFTASQRCIRRIDSLANSSNDAETTMARNLKISLATRVSETSSLFRKKQSAYLKKLRSLSNMSAPLDNPSASHSQNPYTDPAMLDSEADSASAQQTLQQTQSQLRARRTGMADSAIQQREREIEKIAQGVIDLSQLFQELNSLVIDQGSMLDRIDYNVERTAEQTKEAEKELRVATGYQKRTTKRKILLLLLLLVVGMFILLLVKPKSRETVVETRPPSVAARAGVAVARDGGTRVDEGVASVGAPLSGVKRRRVEWKRSRRRKIAANGLSSMPL
ncbi:hypothetical protein MBLNU230_g4890t1 [Neophaeotheca triangularis]